MTAQKDAAKRVADYATQEISAMGLPKEEWLDIMIDASDMFLVEHELEEFDDVDYEEPEEDFNPERVDKVVPGQEYIHTPFAPQGGG